MKASKLIQFGCFLLLALIVVLAFKGKMAPDLAATKQTTTTTVEKRDQEQSLTTITKADQQAEKKQAAATKKAKAKEAKLEAQKGKNFWKEASEQKEYPELKATDEIDVSLTDQQVKIKRGEKTLYTMRCSADNATPTGNFAIEDVRGDNFYNQAENAGGNYYVSFYQQGTNIFQSVPTDSSGEYLTKKAKKLGEQTTTNGSIWLSVADAKWFYQAALTGMTVVVR